ncbi:MAG: HAMP domain-containing sensor histidine kinase [Elusimicrobia bacterium]|nr:HAMP domain-containing sensor histidine kinase [Elusimicrobiota bacterium]
MGLQRVNAFLGQRKGLVWAFGAVLLLVIGWADHATKIEYGFGLFYLLPVVLFGWHLGFWPGMGMAAACSLAWFAMDFWDYLGQGEAFARLSLICWNGVMALGIFMVVTAALSRLRQAWDRERSVAKLKGDMLSLVSHEFNNSLTSMGMALLLLRENDGSTDARRNVYAVLERIHRLLKVTVSNFLNQARMQSGAFSLDIRRIELRRTVREIADLLKPLSDQKGIAFELDFPEQITPISADPDALTLVMSNLIGNAIKYTPKQGRVSVRLRRLTPAEGPPEVEVSVEDTGIGIADNEREAIFQGFYRTEAGKKEARGYGVGLKISQAILRSHGTALALESSPGRGSRFYFRLPICPEDCPHQQAEPCPHCPARKSAGRQELSGTGVQAP